MGPWSPPPGPVAGPSPELWPLGTKALALAMEVSVLEAKRLGHRAVLRLSWLLLVASVALSTRHCCIWPEGAVGG